MKKYWRLIFIPIVLSIMFLGWLGFKYASNSELAGQWIPENKAELTEFPEGYRFSVIGTWTLGNKKNLRCDLWNCSGYDDGKFKITDSNGIKKLELRFDKHSVMYLKYKIETINGEEFLTLSDAGTGNSDVYKKVRK